MREPGRSAHTPDGAVCGNSRPSAPSSPGPSPRERRREKGAPAVGGSACCGERVADPELRGVALKEVGNVRSLAAFAPDANVRSCAKLTIAPSAAFRAFLPLPDERFGSNSGPPVDERSRDGDGDGVACQRLGACRCASRDSLMRLAVGQPHAETQRLSLRQIVCSGLVDPVDHLFGFVVARALGVVFAGPDDR